MRKLAIFAGAFSAAVFAANFGLPEELLIFVGLCLIPLMQILRFALRKQKDCRLRLALTLVCVGAALGLNWTALYARIWFQPARELDERTVRLTATVADWPKETEYGYSVLAEADTESFVRVTTLFYLDDQGAALRPGDKIAIVAHCTLGDRTFAGEEITYYTAKGIFLRAEAYGRLEVQRAERVPVQYWPAVFSKDLKGSIDQVFPEEAAPILRALVTGNRDNLTDEFTTSLERTGLSHTVAVSGMHLAFLASLLTLLLGRGKRSTALLTIVWAVLFSGVAGNTPSVVRAAMMIVMLQIAPLVRRERDGLTSLAFAMMVLLAWNPFSAAHVGLQLSFGAVAGILLTSDRIQDWARKKLGLDRRRKKGSARILLAVPDFIVSTLSATVGAMVFTVPLTAFRFNTFSLIAPVSNLCTLWAVSLLFLGGLLLGTLGIFLPGIAAVLAIPFTVLAGYLDWVINRLSRLPFAALPMESVYYRAWLVLLYLFLVAALLCKGKKRLVVPVCAGGAALAAAILFAAASFRAGDLTVMALDVGQGQSILLRWDDRLALVDCGGDSRDDPGDVAANVLQSRGYSRLDLLALTHCHGDHVNGVPQLLRRMEVGTLLLPEPPEGEENDPLRQEILALAQEQGTEIHIIREDTRLDFGEGDSLTLYAPLGLGEDTNELGMTALATAGAFDALITGDMGGEGERLLVDHASLPDIELLVAGHHGSKESTTPELLAAVKPELAFVSVGLRNLYGHPAAETLTRLGEAGVQIYRTDLQGTVSVQAGGS